MIDEQLTPNNNDPMVKPLDSKVSGTMFYAILAITVVVCALLGVFTGKALSGRGSATPTVNGQKVEVVKTSTEEGVKDAATFKDTASGDVVANDGKLTDEGSHILKRGDNSQNVYLTSTVIDLEKYVGKKVQVWGQTFQGQKAGWLMDVGRIKILQ